MALFKRGLDMKIRGFEIIFRKTAAQDFLEFGIFGI
jgi:hypothetical protein